jgi:hypothetical protein
VGAPVEIEMEIREPTANEWPEAVQNELVDIINVNPKTDASSIIMKVSCAWDGSEESYIPRWEFLNSDRKPFAGKGARAINLQEFFQYIPVFYLEALRDVADEYSSRYRRSLKRDRSAFLTFSTKNCWMPTRRLKDSQSTCHELVMLRRQMDLVLRIFVYFP